MKAVSAVEASDNKLVNEPTLWIKLCHDFVFDNVPDDLQKASLTHRLNPMGKMNNQTFLLAIKFICAITISGG